MVLTIFLDHHNHFIQHGFKFTYALKIIKIVNKKFIQKSIKRTYSKAAIVIQRNWRMKHKNDKLKR